MAIFRLAVETALELDDGAKRKMRKPKDNKAANTSVMGFVRRIDLGRAMMKRGEVPEGPREILNLRAIPSREARPSGLEPYFGLTISESKSC